MSKKSIAKRTNSIMERLEDRILFDAVPDGGSLIPTGEVNEVPVTIRDLSINGNGSADVLEGGYGNDKVNGRGGNDRIWTSLGEDRLYGGSGNDILDGGAQNDRLNGGSGNDHLVGGHGDDVLVGNGGNDVLLGSSGNDQLTGSSGKDKFVFGRGFGQDTVVDFKSRQGDSIKLKLFGQAFDSFGEIQAIASQHGRDTVLDFGGGDVLTLKNVKISDLSAEDFGLFDNMTPPNNTPLVAPEPVSNVSTVESTPPQNEPVPVVVPAESSSTTSGTFAANVKQGHIWFETFDAKGDSAFEFRFGSAGVISEIKDARTGQELLAPSFQGESTDRVVQWTLWEIGGQVVNDIATLPDYEDRFNVTQAGTFDDVFQETVEVNLDAEKGRLDVWSVAENQWKSQQDPFLDGTVASLTRYEILENGSLKIRRVLYIGGPSVIGQPADFGNAYLEAWSPFSDRAFDSMALNLDSKGNPNHWYADGKNIPYYPKTKVSDTRGWAIAYDRHSMADGAAIGLVFGTDSGTVHFANGDTGQPNRYALNSMDFDGGLAILPGLSIGEISAGTVVDQSFVLLPTHGLSGDTKIELDRLASEIAAPQIYLSGASTSAELSNIIDRLETLPAESGAQTDKLGQLL